MTVKRIIMSAVLGSIAAMALAVPAQAQHKKEYHCTIEASATASVQIQDLSGTFIIGPVGLGIDCIFTAKKTSAPSKSRVVSRSGSPRSSVGRQVRSTTSCVARVRRRMTIRR